MVNFILNKLDLICSLIIKWFQVIFSNTNNSIEYQSFFAHSNFKYRTWLKNSIWPIDCIYSLHNELDLLHKYTSTRASDRVQQSVWHNHVWYYLHSYYPLGFLPTNYCLTRVTCIVFLLLEYMFFNQPFLSSPCLSFVSITTDETLTFTEPKRTWKLWWWKGLQPPYLIV